MINNTMLSEKDYTQLKFAEDSTQYAIRTELEEKVAQEAFDLYWDLVALNMIHNDVIQGDRRKKRNIKMERVLEKYIEQGRKDK